VLRTAGEDAIVRPLDDAAHQTWLWACRAVLEAAAAAVARAEVEAAAAAQVEEAEPPELDAWLAQAGLGSWASCGCPVEARAREYAATLGIADAYFDRRFDRCYCDRCYPAAWPDTISNEGPTPYVVPRGWFRFGLALPPKAKALNIFDKWSVSFHGTKSPLVLQSGLDCGQLMKAGDTLLDGTILRSAKCAGRQDKVFYTSPTIKYAGLKFYAEPQPFGSRDQSASIALQCRQKPGSFKTQGETMGFGRWPGHLERECPHVDLGTLEWMSAINVAAIPYGLLIRTFGADDEGYRSPVDWDF
jgi:hypothetical protein